MAFVSVEHVEEIEEKALDTFFNATSLAEGYGMELLVGYARACS